MSKVWIVATIRYRPDKDFVVEAAFTSEEARDAWLARKAEEWYAEHPQDRGHPWRGSPFVAVGCVEVDPT